MKTNHALLTGFKYAFAGVWYVVRSQRNARIHLSATAAVVALGIWVGLSQLEWAILALVVGMVLAAECFNTAAEVTVDLVTKEHNPLAKIAKDTAAAGVLLTAMVAVIVGVLILGIPLLHRLGVPLQ